MQLTRPALAIMALFLSSPGHAQDSSGPLPRPRTITVVGSGESKLKPDMAHIVVTVGTTGETLAQAVDANRSASERVLARFQSLGVKRDDLETADFRVFQTPPRVGPDGREVRAPRFTAHHQLRVTTRDVDGVGRLTGEILTVEGITFQSLAWGLDRPEEGNEEARREAVRDARRRAETYAMAAGARLGALMEIRDGPVVRPFAGPEADMPMRSLAAKEPELPIVPPANVRSFASVQMVWELEQRP